MTALDLLVESLPAVFIIFFLETVICTLEVSLMPLDHF